MWRAYNEELKAQEAEEYSVEADDEAFDQIEFEHLLAFQKERVAATKPQDTKVRGQLIPERRSGNHRHYNKNLSLAFTKKSTKPTLTKTHKIKNENKENNENEEVLDETDLSNLNNNYYYTHPLYNNAIRHETKYSDKNRKRQRETQESIQEDMGQDYPSSFNKQRKNENNYSNNNNNNNRTNQTRKGNNTTYNNSSNNNNTKNRAQNSKYNRHSSVHTRNLIDRQIKAKELMEQFEMADKILYAPTIGNNSDSNVKKRTTSQHSQENHRPDHNNNNNNNNRTHRSSSHGDKPHQKIVDPLYDGKEKRVSKELSFTLSSKAEDIDEF